VPGLCRARAGLGLGGVPRCRQRQEDAWQRAPRDGGVAPRARRVVLCPDRPLGPAVSRYWHGQASLVEAVVRPRQPARLRRCARAANATYLL